jgi:hypothetical protein
VSKHVYHKIISFSSNHTLWYYRIFYAYDFACSIYQKERNDTSKTKLKKKCLNEKMCTLPLFFLIIRLGFFYFFPLYAFSNETLIRKTNWNKRILRYTSNPNELNFDFIFYSFIFIDQIQNWESKFLIK